MNNIKRTPKCITAGVKHGISNFRTGLPVFWKLDMEPVLADFLPFLAAFILLIVFAFAVAIVAFAIMDMVTWLSTAKYKMGFVVYLSMIVIVPFAVFCIAKLVMYIAKLGARSKT